MLFFRDCDGVPSEHQVWAGGSRRKMPQLYVSCISTPPHCLTLTAVFYLLLVEQYSMRAHSSSALLHNIQRHLTQARNDSPLQPPDAHTHTRTLITAAAVLHEQRCARTAAALRMPLGNTFFFFARQVIPLWIGMNLWRGHSDCSAADMTIADRMELVSWLNTSTCWSVNLYKWQIHYKSWSLAWLESVFYLSLIGQRLCHIIWRRCQNRTDLWLWAWVEVTELKLFTDQREAGYHRNSFITQTKASLQIVSSPVHV